ncbi:MAG: polyprenyl synthetase family protein [Gammaproteobacteria bacterium]|nr:polyprenyl synthetase family protein [Gammaproteobacteria bacterium]
MTPVLALIEDDFAAVNCLIANQLTSRASLVEEIGHYLIESGGKRLRPALVLLAARCCEYDGKRHIALATIIEYLHTATLLHDDVVDRSKLTANSLWGNAPSVLVGDFLYSRAFQLMVELDNQAVLSILADATNLIAQGEVMQFSDVGNLSITEERYMEVIRCKSALLFQAAAQSGAVLGGGNPEQVAALRNFGLEFGMAYQLVDDWLDYAGDAKSMGKNAGDDLAEGKLTLPLIFTLANGASAQVDLVRESLITRSAARLDDVLSVVKACGALDYTRAAAMRHSQRAMQCLQALPNNEYRQALRAFTEFAQARMA